MNSLESEVFVGLKACKIASDEASLSLKLISGSRFPIYLCEQIEPPLAIKVMEDTEMARTEYNGLKLLAESGAPVPTPRGTYQGKEGVYLFLDYVRPGRNSRESTALLMENLIRLYQTKHPQWGLGEDNFIGPLVQPNNFHNSFDSFWWSERIEPQLKMGRRSGLIDERLARQVEESVNRCMEEWKFSRAGARLVHGDLWSGNVLFSGDGPYLIDPSVAYSHPEQDLAMLNLFGSPLGRSDNEKILSALGLEPGFNERCSFWQIYPLLVHVNIFGGGYVGQLAAAAREYL